MKSLIFVTDAHLGPILLTLWRLTKEYIQLRNHINVTIAATNVTAVLILKSIATWGILKVISVNINRCDVIELSSIVDYYIITRNCDLNSWFINCSIVIIGNDCDLHCYCSHSTVLIGWKRNKDLFKALYFLQLPKYIDIWS